MAFMLRFPRRLGLVLSLWLAASATHAAAQPKVPNDPYRYDLRVGVFPVAFQAGISQSRFGSAARVEYDVARHVSLSLSGLVPWLNVAGEKDPRGYGVRAGLSLHLIDDEVLEPLSGTVIPEDTPAVGGPGPGTDQEFEMPVSQRMGGPRMSMPNDDRDAKAPMRSLHSIRVGYDLTRAVERGRQDNEDGTANHFLNTFHSFYAGYSWGEHWNLNASAGGGERRIGWRHIYVDAIFTLPALNTIKAVGPNPPKTEPDFFPVGLRLGLEGSIAALIHAAPGVGFGYGLELGALPGYSGFEGYLTVALGLQLDFATRDRSLR
jgi:hypothetical protein